MKKILFILMLISTLGYAQAPEKMNYQAVARDLSGLPLVSTTVNLQFDILQGSTTGAVAYSETQTKTTNQFGLFTAEIGAGSVVSGSFPGITWGSNPYYLRITVNGDVMPATQLLSVPYALYSKTTGGTGASLVAGPGIDITGGVITATSDTSATNEFQMLSISNDTIFLSNGGFVLLPSGASDTDWVQGSGVIYNTNDNVGIGIVAPVDKLEVEAVTGNVSAIKGVNNQIGIGSPTYGIYGVSAGDALNSAGVKGEATGSEGTGVYGEINSNIDAVGVRGYHNGIAPGYSYGVAGRISSSSANSFSTGVSGINFGTGVGVSSFVSNGASNEKTSLAVTATSGVTPTPGLGSRIDFKTGNTASGTSPIASITATATNVTAGSTAGDLSFSTIQNSNIRTKRMIIKSNGNTGIGTLTPSALLDVAGVTQTDSLRVLSGAGNVGDVLTSDAAGNATWQAPAGTGGIDADADGWPASLDLNDADNTITFYDADNDSLNELQQLILVGDSLALTKGGGSITIPDADPNNERITSFSLNGTSDSLAIIESGVRHTMPLSDLNNGAWTKGIGNDIFNNTDSVGIGTADPKSLLQLGDFMHQFPLVLSGTEEYTVSSYNSFWDGATLRNTTGGISGFSIMGDDNGIPVMSWLLFPSQPLGTDMFSVNPILRMNLRSRGLAINSDVAGAGLDVTSLDSAAIFMDVPDDNSQPTLSYRAPGGSQEILGLRVPNTLTNSYTLTYPIGLPTTAGSALVSDLAGNLSWSAAGASPWVTNGTTIHPATLTQNVGIGSNSAAYALEIKRSQAGTTPLLGITNPTTGDASIHFSTGTGNFSIGRNGNTFKIAQASNLGSNVRMTIGSTGNVGFGITAPTAKVHAEGFGGQAMMAQNSSATTATMNLMNFGGGPALTVTNGFVGINIATPTAPIHTGGTNNIAARFESSSNVGTWLEMSNSSAGGQFFSIINTGSANGEGAGKLLFNRNTSFGGSAGNIMTFEHSTSHVGIGTNAPNTSLDVAKDIAFREFVNATTTNLISNMAGTAGTSFINFTSQTSNFSILSIADGVDGKILRLFNSTGFNMTVANDTGTSNSILTMSGGNISTVGQGVITLQYSANEQRWIVVSIVQ